MSLMKDGLWSLVSGKEFAEGAEQQAKFAARKDKALVIIVLSIDPSLLYLIVADPADPVLLWKTLAIQFERKLGQTTRAET